MKKTPPQYWLMLSQELPESEVLMKKARRVQYHDDNCLLVTL